MAGEPKEKKSTTSRKSPNKNPNKGPKKRKKKIPGVDWNGHSYFYKFRVPKRFRHLTDKDFLEQAGFTSDIEAQDAMKIVYAKLAEGKPVTKPEDWTLEEFLWHWMKVMIKGSVEASTYDSYEAVVKLICKDLGHLQLAQLKPMQLTEYFKKKLDDGLGRTYVKKFRDQLKRALEEAVNWGMINTNPAARARIPNVKVAKDEEGQDRITRKPFSFEQMVVILEACWDGKYLFDDVEWDTLTDEQKRKMQKKMTTQKTINRRYYDHVLLALLTGLRIGEVSVLKWSDFDFDLKVMHVKRAAKRIKGSQGVPIGSPKTDASNRSIPLADGLVNRLKSRKAEQNIEKMRCRITYKEQGYVLTTFDGQPHKPSTVSDWFSRLIRQIKFPAGLEINPEHHSFHSLRHTTATWLYHLKVDAETRREILGHTNFEMTNHYTHVPHEVKLAAINRIDEVLKKIM